MEPFSLRLRNQRENTPELKTVEERLSDALSSFKKNKVLSIETQKTPSVKTGKIPVTERDINFIFLLLLKEEARLKNHYSEEAVRKISLKELTSFLEKQSDITIISKEIIKRTVLRPYPQKIQTLNKPQEKMFGVPVPRGPIGEGKLKSANDSI
jgi:hypothetical protein